jgi:HEAT repeat protein
VAAETLGLLGTTQATQALLAALDDPHGTVEVQVRAAGALGRIGAPAAFGPLVACLAPDRAPALRVAAVQALGLLGGPRAVPHLVPMLAAAHQLASAAGASLGMLGPAGATALDTVSRREPETPAGRQAAAALATVELAARRAGATTTPESGSGTSRAAGRVPARTSAH